MEDPAKYVIRAKITANGVVERSDVVGAVFGQTEGLLGTDLDLRSLQESERVGRIDVDIESRQGMSEGDLAIATEMDRVETAVLAAGLETIERVGPCRATIEVKAIEDVRAAKRRQVVERARELLVDGFEDVGLAGRDLVSAVREQTARADIDSFLGYPAGPDAESADELIVVEGRADVLRLLDYGITNVIGVEGTDVAPEIAQLTKERSITAFFDGDRGGNLLLLELAQVGDIDYVTFAPPGQAVEDLEFVQIESALDQKVPYEDAPEAPVDLSEPLDSDDGSADTEAVETSTTREPVDQSLLEHVRAVIEEESGRVRLLDADWTEVASDEAAELPDLLDASSGEVEAVVTDSIVGQTEVDIASRTGVSLVIGRERGEFTKRPIGVRVLTADRLLDRNPPAETST